MIRAERAKARHLAGVLLSLSMMLIGTASGAQVDFSGIAGVQTPVTPQSIQTTQSVQTTTTSQSSTTSVVQQQQAAPKSAELVSAEDRVEVARGKLDQARKVLNAAKASLKAAEAEAKAAKADRDAIALRDTATQLADASGFATTTASDGVRQVIVPPNGNRLTPAAVTPTPITNAPVPQAAPIQGVPATDFNGTQTNADLSVTARPAAVAEPNYVP